MEVRLAEVRLGQARPGEVRIAEIRLAERRLGELRPAEIRAHVWINLPPRIPGFYAPLHDLEVWVSHEL